MSCFIDLAIAACIYIPFGVNIEFMSLRVLGENYSDYFSIERFIKLAIPSRGMKQETVTIPKEEYKKLKKKEKIDTELLKDIAMGIKDVLSGKIKEV